MIRRQDVLTNTFYNEIIVCTIVVLRTKKKDLIEYFRRIKGKISFNLQT